MIAFSADSVLRRGADQRRPDVTELTNEEMSPLFEAVVEATEEAVYNSLFMATPVTNSQGRTIEPVPIDRVQAILKKYGHQ